MYRELLVRAALLVGPQITRTGTFQKPAGSLLGRIRPSLQRVGRHEIDSIELRPRFVHRLAARIALGFDLTKLGLPRGCVWHTNGLGHASSDLFLSNINDCVTTVRDIVQNRLGQPELVLEDINESFGEVAQLPHAERERRIFERSDWQRRQDHAERIEQLLCARNPYTPAQLQKRFMRVSARSYAQHAAPGI